MAKCYNKQSKEYKALKSEYGTDIATSILISQWESLNGEDSIPSVADVQGMVANRVRHSEMMRREFKSDILVNLENKGLTYSKKGKVLIKRGREQDVINFLTHSVKLQPSSYKVKKAVDSELIVKEHLIHNVDVIKSQITEKDTRILPLLSQLKRTLPGVSVQYVSIGEAGRIHDSIAAEDKTKDSIVDVKSFYHKGVAYIVEGVVDAETAVEEVLHGFVESIRVDNPALFSNLIEEAQKSFPKLYKQIQERYNDRGGFVEQDRNIELVTQALTKHFMKDVKKPSRSWVDVVKKVLKWFVKQVRLMYKVTMGGKMSISPGFIKSSTTFSDIAQMLNTDEFSFEIDVNASNKVRYALAEHVQKSIDSVKEQASNNIQREVVNQLFHQPVEMEEVVDDFTTSEVVYNEQSESYVDVETGAKIIEGYKAVTGSMKSQVNSMILSAVASGSSVDFEIDYDNNLYRDITLLMDGRRDDGSILIPGVIISDFESEVATRVPFIKVAPNGQLQIINIQHNVTSTKVTEDSYLYKADEDVTLNAKQENSIEVNLMRRILENMGYDVKDETLTFVVNDAGNVVATVQNVSSENTSIVGEIVKDNVDVENRDIINELTYEENGSHIKETPEVEKEEDTPINNSTYDSIFTALRNFDETLATREESIRNARNIITLNKSKHDIIKEIQLTRSMIDQVHEDPELLRGVYTDVVRDAIRQIREFRIYVTDPSNFNDQEFITKVLNWQKFVENFRGLAFVKGAKGLNTTERDYIGVLQDELNTLAGVKKSDGTIIDAGVFDIAIHNYVRTLVKENSNRNFSEEELNELMRSAQDISSAEYMTGDLATSRDTLLALMDKKFKKDRQHVLSKIQDRSVRIRAAALKLSRLSPSKDIDYSFMLEFDNEGVFTGRYVQKISPKYYATLKELRQPLYNDQGKPKEFIEISNIDEATPEQLAYNKQLARDKEALGVFLSPEIRTSSRTEKGEYHNYSEEFITARANHEVFMASKQGKGYWVRRRSTTDKDWAAYRGKYYTRRDGYMKAVRDKSGDPTGAVEQADGMFSVRRDYVEKRDVTSKGESMVSDKWNALHNPHTELEKAQLEYYNMFTSVYDDMLDKLPENVKMQGKVPVIERTTSESLKDKKNVVARLWVRMKRGVSNLINPTTTVKKAFFDEHGNVITNSLPIFYTGSVKNESEFARIDADIKAKEEEYSNADNQTTKTKLYNELKMLRGELRVFANKPTTRNISMDMTDSLLKFTAMSENYETMSAAEDTYLSMIKVLGDREYLDSNGNMKEDIDMSSANKTKDPVTSEARITARAKKWMKMVFYDNDNDTKTLFDKLAKGLISYTSLAYVGSNVFGNLNNYAFGRISNSIETAGQRFYSAKSMARAVIEFNKKMGPDLMKHLGEAASGYTDKDSKYKEHPANSKYGAMISFFRALDSESDMMEKGDTSDLWNKLTSWTYILQHAGEFNVQSKIAMASLISTEAIKKNENGPDEVISLYDALMYDHTTGAVTMKEGFTHIKMYNSEKEMTWDDNSRYELRNYMREVNKQIHGNYAYEDRMVIQSHSLGQLAAQFHKWVAPSIKARFRPEYFDENLGWMEGRYLTFWNFLGHAYKNIGEIGNLSNSFKEFNGDKGKVKLANVHRVMGEIGIIMSLFIVKSLLMSAFGMGDDDDNEDPFSTKPMSLDATKENAIIRKLQNILLYQVDRLQEESVTFVPIPGMGGFTQVGQFIKTPLASTRTLGEMGGAMEMTVATGLTWMLEDPEEFLENKDVVYQRGNRAGQLKLGKEWGDIVPILYTVNKWKSFDTVSDFYIK